MHTSIRACFLYSFYNPYYLLVAIYIWHLVIPTYIIVPLLLATIRGADIVGEITKDINSGEPLDFHWKGHGLKLYIPADALTPTTSNPEPIKMTIKASITGQYLLPSDLELVSGVYWVSFSKIFSKPVILSVQHCCSLEDPTQMSSLCFVTANCTQELPYSFKKMTGSSTFSTDSCYGTIELKHFSGVAIGQFTQREKIARGRWNKRYRAQVYFFSDSHGEGNTLIKNVHIPVVWDLDLYRKVGSNARVYYHTHVPLYILGC